MKPVSVVLFFIGVFFTVDAFSVDFPTVQSGFVKKTGADSDFIPLMNPTDKEIHLKAEQFPKTFQDVPFEDRLEILREGYLPYRIEYDENGVCISGCAYPGITIVEDMAAVDEATEEIADLIEKSENDSNQKQDKKYRDDKNPPIDSGKGKKTGGKQGGDTGTTYAQDWCRNGLSTKLPLRYPVDMSNFKYRITSDFGYRKNSSNGARFHPAIDIGCPSGTPVYATADGVVVTVANETKPGGAGNYINIKHENGLITQYLHLNKVLVSKGDRVSACQQIALSGNTGQSTTGKPYGAHLDYRIRFDSNRNKYVDILCPCKVATKSNESSSNAGMSCMHSLFNSPYKFRKYNPNSDETKRSLWRVEHGHCMRKNTDLLPDEVAP